MAASLGIGTVQFGMHYGVSNRNGQSNPSEIANILTLAASRGVRLIDTAPAYGTSELMLGANFPVNHEFDLVTKTPKNYGREFNAEKCSYMEETFERSLSRLNLSSVYALLAHDADDLLGKDGNKFFDSMVKIKDRGQVNKIGVSIYTAAQIDLVLDRYPIDLIQIPVSVFDQRLIVSGHLTKLCAANIEIHIRSAFLQGLLLLEPHDLPDHFQPIRHHLYDYRRALLESGISPVEAALGFVRNLRGVDCVLVGVCSQGELLEILQASDTSLPPLDYDRFSIMDESIVNPDCWPKFTR